MATPQDWAPYSSLEDAANVYLRDPDVALVQLRGFVDLASIQAFIMSRRGYSEGGSESLWQEVVLIDGRRLIMWRATDEESHDREPRPILETSVRTILLSSVSDQILTTEFDVLSDGTRRLAQVTLRMYTQLLTRAHQKSATDTDLYCESFRYSKSVDDGGLAQMERLMQFSRALSRAGVS